MKTPLKKGIGSYSKGKKFTLRSGNTPSGFKMMGSSPYKKPLVGDQDQLPEHIQKNILAAPGKQVDDEKGEVKVKNTTTNEEGGKGKKILKKVGNTLVAALTGGLDAVYGSGKIMPGGGSKITFSDDKKEKEEKKDTKSPGEKIIDGDKDKKA